MLILSKHLNGLYSSNTSSVYSPIIILIPKLDSGYFSLISYKSSNASLVSGKSSLLDFL